MKSGYVKVWRIITIFFLTDKEAPQSSLWNVYKGKKNNQNGKYISFIELPQEITINQRLKRTEINFLTVPEVQSQDFGRTMLSLKAPGEDPSSSLPASVASGFVGLYQAISSVPPPSRDFLPCVSVSSSLLRRKPLFGCRPRSKSRIILSQGP